MVHQKKTISNRWSFFFSLFYFIFLSASFSPLPDILALEVNVMSPKELLYIDDALGHEKFLISQCQKAANALKDPQLRGFAQQLQNTHQQLFNQLYQLI